MGNLGRAGYGATNEGVWPYSYDACDVGALKNQTTPDGTGPAAALVPPSQWDASLSYLPGQKLSACTCKGEDHPGPWLDDEDRYRGRSAPEIDIRKSPWESKCLPSVVGALTDGFCSLCLPSPFSRLRLIPYATSLCPSRVFDTIIFGYLPLALQWKLVSRELSHLCMVNSKEGKLN